MPSAIQRATRFSAASVESSGKMCRAHDVVARYGGEEFVVLMPTTLAIDALDVAERLRAAINCESWPLRKVTASLGVSTSDSQHSERGRAPGPGRPGPLPFKAGRTQP